MFQQLYTNPTNLVSADCRTIGTAVKTIDFAAYSLTDHAILEALRQRAGASVQVRVYLDRGELEAEARGHGQIALTPLAALVNLPNLTIRVKSSTVLMHLKSYCVDSRILRDGSANFSPLGLGEQDNSVTYTDDSQAVAAFEAKFSAMWARPDNLSPDIAIQHLRQGYAPGTRVLTPSPELNPR